MYSLVIKVTNQLFDYANKKLIFFKTLEAIGQVPADNSATDKLAHDLEALRLENERLRKELESSQQSIPTNIIPNVSCNFFNSLLFLRLLHCNSYFIMWFVLRICMILVHLFACRFF